MKTWTKIILLSLTLSLIGLWVFDWAQYRNREEMREALMIDTRSDMSSHKGNKSYNTVGIFRDKQTGNIFGDSINDSLYRQFAKDGKPIECEWPYSIDKMEQTSIGVFAAILAFLLWMISASIPIVYYLEIRGDK